MKGIYFSEGLHMDQKNKQGIERKVSYQIECLRNFSKVEHINLNIDDCSIIDKIKFILPIINSKREKNRNYLLNKIDNTINYIYIRKPSLTINFYKLLKKIKNKNQKIIILMEIPTFPFHNEYKGINKLMAIKSWNCEKKLYKVVDYILTYSDDKLIWNIPCINCSNCVKYSIIKPRSANYRPQKNNIRLTCVANFVYWHGVDRIIKGIQEYDGNYQITLNIVGGGPEINNLKKMANNDDRIIFWGEKTNNELDIIFDQTDIAVDALGRHRSGVSYNSSLKGKEYVARGIPVISAVKTELDNYNDFNYYLKIPADESNINMFDVISFFEKIYLNESANSITRKIRNYTFKKFDYKYGFEAPIKELIYKKTEKTN